MSQYHIISSQKCTWCHKAMDTLDAHNIDYTVSYLDTKPWLKTLMLKAELYTVPQIFDAEGDLVGTFQQLEVALTNVHS
jgi:glutaredoxin